MNHKQDFIQILSDTFHSFLFFLLLLFRDLFLGLFGVFVFCYYYSVAFSFDESFPRSSYKAH